MIKSWMPCGRSVYPCRAHPNVIRQMRVHSPYFVKSVEMVLSCLIFPLQLPPSPNGPVISEWKDPWGDSSIGILGDLSGWPEIIYCVEHVAVVEWPFSWIEVSLCLPCYLSI